MHWEFSIFLKKSLPSSQSISCKHWVSCHNLPQFV